MIRSKAIQQTSAFERPPHLFLNTHPAELQEPGLAESMKAVREVSPSQRLTLEIHEKAVGDLAALSNLHAALREIGVGLAFDDFGAGQGRLLELAKVKPDYLKFDISLIHSIHAAPREHRQMVASLVRMVREMGVVPLAEGIECEKEHEACLEMGFELAQGFFFGRPVALRHILS
jgi:EAL domain-containing protein (putative c-di-GMP-specific phosphodiesterase class I)